MPCLHSSSRTLAVQQGPPGTVTVSVNNQETSKADWQALAASLGALPRLDSLIVAGDLPSSLAALVERCGGLTELHLSGETPPQRHESLLLLPAALTPSLLPPQVTWTAATCSWWRG